MDQRQTFSDISELKNILIKLIEDKKNADFLIEKNGLTRLSGVINELKEGGDNLIVVNGNSEIKLNDIIAVNGIFQSDYSEC